MTAMPEPGEVHAPLRSKVAPVVKILVATVGAVFFSAGTVGAFEALTNNSTPSVSGMLVVGAFALLALGSVGYGFKQAMRWQRGGAEPIAPSVRTAQRSVVLSFALGFGIAVLLLIGQTQNGTNSDQSILSNAPLPHWTAAVLIALTLTAVPWMTIIWQRSADEHELRSYKDGALYAFYAYSLLSACWWFGARAGFFPPVDGVAIFMIVHLLWCAIWLWRRS